MTVARCGKGCQLDSGVRFGGEESKSGCWEAIKSVGVSAAWFELPKVSERGGRARTVLPELLVAFVFLIVLFSYKNIWLGKSLSYEFVDVAEGVFGRIVIFFYFVSHFFRSI